MKFFKKRKCKIALTKNEVSMLIDAIRDRIVKENLHKAVYIDLPFEVDMVKDYMDLEDKLVLLFFDGKWA